MSEKEALGIANELSGLLRRRMSEETPEEKGELRPALGLLCNLCLQLHSCQV
jgi:hypothetical protein